MATANLIPQMLRSTRRRLAGRLLAPQLGRLHQYAPRCLPLAKLPGADALPANPPTISIVTPSFRQGRFLERTIRSVLAQGYPKLQYVVQDGGSDDETPAILAQYAPHLAHWESAPDRGQADALNRGFARTCGEVLAYLNADDLLLPGALAAVARFFARRPEVDVVYGHRILIDEEDREVGRWILPPHEPAALLWRDFVPQETLFWRRRVWEAVGARFDESLHFALDWDLLLRWHAAGARFARLPRFLGAFRVHPGQKTAAQYSSVGQAEVERLRARHHGRPVSEAEVSRRVRGYLRRHVVCATLWRLGLLRY